MESASTADVNGTCKLNTISLYYLRIDCELYLADTVHSFSLGFIRPTNYPEQTTPEVGHTPTRQTTPEVGHTPPRRDKLPQRSGIHGIMTNYPRGRAYMV